MNVYYFNNWQIILPRTKKWISGFMEKLNKKYKIWMRRHLINRCINLIESDEGLTKNHHSRLDSEAHHIMGCEVLIDCHSPMDMTGSFHEQKVAAAWRYRLNDSVNLALKMKLFKSTLYPVSIGEKNFYSSRYVTTRFGKIFRSLPEFFQSSLISIYLTASRVSAVATRFKWVTGIVSFAVLAIKVWHSGLISNWWIAASALIGLAIGFLATLWR